MWPVKFVVSWWIFIWLAITAGYLSYLASLSSLQVGAFTNNLLWIRMSRPDMGLLRREHQSFPIAWKIPPPPSRMSIVLENLRRQQRTRRPPESRVQQHIEPLLPCSTPGRTSGMHGKCWIWSVFYAISFLPYHYHYCLTSYLFLTSSTFLVVFYLIVVAAFRSRASSALLSLSFLLCIYNNEFIIIFHPHRTSARKTIYAVWKKTAVHTRHLTLENMNRAGRRFGDLGSFGALKFFSCVRGWIELRISI